MRGFVISIVTLLLILALSLVNSYLLNKCLTELYSDINMIKDSSGTEQVLRIKGCSQLLEKKKKFLRFSLRLNEIESLESLLNNAYVYCSNGDESETNVCIANALFIIEEWQNKECCNNIL